MLTVNVQQEKYSVHQGDSIKVICSWSGVPSATSVLWKKYVQLTSLLLTAMENMMEQAFHHRPS